MMASGCSVSVPVLAVWVGVSASDVWVRVMVFTVWIDSDGSGGGGMWLWLSAFCSPGLSIPNIPHYVRVLSAPGRSTSSVERALRRVSVT